MAIPKPRTAREATSAASGSPRSSCVNGTVPTRTRPTPVTTRALGDTASTVRLTSTEPAAAPTPWGAGVSPVRQADSPSTVCR